MVVVSWAWLWFRIDGLIPSPPDGLGKGEFGGGISKSEKFALQFYFSLLKFRLGR